MRSCFVGPGCACEQRLGLRNTRRDLTLPRAEITRAPMSMVCPLKFSVLATSSASTPPLVPFHASPVSVPPRVRLPYWGTRITWKLRRGVVLVGLAWT